MLLKCKLNKCQGILLTEINISKGGVGERQQCFHFREGNISENMKYIQLLAFCEQKESEHHYCSNLEIKLFKNQTYTLVSFDKQFFKNLALPAGLSMLMKIRQTLCRCFCEQAVNDSTERKVKRRLKQTRQHEKKPKKKGRIASFQKQLL